MHQSVTLRCLLGVKQSAIPIFSIGQIGLTFDCKGALNFFHYLSNVIVLINFVSDFSNSSVCKQNGAAVKIPTSNIFKQPNENVSKLTSNFHHCQGVNFINILRAAFAPIFLCQKITKPNCRQKKFSAQEYWRKSCS